MTSDHRPSDRTASRSFKESSEIAEFARRKSAASYQRPCAVSTGLVATSFNMSPTQSSSPPTDPTQSTSYRHAEAFHMLAWYAYQRLALYRGSNMLRFLGSPNYKRILSRKLSQFYSDLAPYIAVGFVC